MTTIPGFLTKTYEIFNTPEYTDCCGWGNNGSTIVIKKIEQFSKSVLPKYFKHSNFQSFVRQLNMYDFRKTVQDPNHGEFQHPNFRQDRPELLPNIKRKAHHKSSESSKKLLGGLHPEPQEYSATTLGNVGNVGIQYSENTIVGVPKNQMIYEFKEEGSSADSEVLGVGGEVIRQQGMREEFELRMQNIESESVRIAGENAVLKQLILESRLKQAVMQDKMEKVLKTLYNVFMGGGNSNNLSISTNSTNSMIPAPTRSNLGPQMLENLLFRLDSLQTYGVRMNSEAANTPGGVDIGSIFGEEDTVPLSTIAADMTQLVTSSRNGKNGSDITNFNDGTYAGSTNSGAVNLSISRTINTGSNIDSRHYSDSTNNFTGIQGTGLAGQPISQMHSFDTMASRVSAPNLLSLDMSVHKSAGDVISEHIEGNNNAITAHTHTNTTGGEVFGGGGLTRQRSIYPGHGDDSGGAANSMLNGIPLDRQDSDTFSWSSLFSMSSVDGYGLNSTSADRTYPPSQGSPVAISDNKLKIKEEVLQEDKHMKRGIAELGSLSDGAGYNLLDKNGDSRENSFRRQRISSYPPLTPHSSSQSALGGVGTSQSSGGTMDPPSHEKPETSEAFYGNLPRHHENSLTRIDSLELTIATLLKSMDSFDASNGNNNSNTAHTAT